MQNETPEPEQEKTFAGTATYCPEDNKLRLYVGRVPRPDYDRLRAAGWVATPKQDCDFAVVWTPEREDMALEFAEIIEDEDKGPDERAADRAERFEEYRGKRMGEATGHADSYDGQPTAHGYQSQARADRAARRHDRQGTRAVSAWSKAEYWQSRTAGVISHALYVSAPGVRMGRIKTIEADIRRQEKSRSDYEATRAAWLECQAIEDPAKQTARALRLAYVEHGDYTHPRTGKESYLFDLGRPDDEERQPDPLNGAELCALYLSRHGPLAPEGRWLTHFRLRLAYEEQMLQAQGGRAAHVEMEAGGWLGGRQIEKVNKSHVTGRVVSVQVRDNHPSHCNHYGNPYPNGETRVLSHTIETERLAADAYTPPTPEEKAAWIQSEKARKAARPKSETIPLINPTDADAERLQAVWNSKRGRTSFDPKEEPKVRRISQAQYSANSGGNYSSFETVEVTSGGFKKSDGGYMRRPGFPAVAKVRASTYSVVIITDKPQKPLPASTWQDPRPAMRAGLLAQAAEVERVVGLALSSMRHERMTDDERRIFEDGQRVGFIEFMSMSQIWTTDAFRDAVKAAPPAPAPAPAPQPAPVIATPATPPATIQPDLFNLDAAIARARQMVAA